jgi:hypothetical protein
MSDRQNPARDCPSRRDLRRRSRLRARLGFEQLESRNLLAAAPAPWQLHDVGAVGTAYQTMTLTPGANGLTAAISTQGATGVGGAGDDVRFLYQQLAGDGEISARIDSLASEDWFAAAGVTIRESLLADAKNVSVLGWSAGATILSMRDANGGETEPVATSWTAGPSYVKLVRSGNNFSGFHSLDGQSWTQLGATQTVSMGTTVYVGLAASAGLDAPVSSVAMFSQVVAPQSVSTTPIGSAPVGLVAKYSTAWGAWVPGREQSGPFRYLWNAPDNWQPSVGAAIWNTGSLGDVDNYQELFYVPNIDGAYNAFKVDPDNSSNDTGPAEGLRLRSGLANPGAAAGFAAGALTNGVDRYAIVAYTIPNLDPNVDEGGFFTIEDSIFSKSSTSGDAVEVLVFTSADPTKPVIRNYSEALNAGASVDTEVVDFDGLVGYVPEGGTIYVAIGADNSSLLDESGFDFSIWRSKPIQVAALAETSPHQIVGSSRVTSYVAPQSGLYGLHDSWIELLQPTAEPVELRVYVGNRLANANPVIVAPGFGRETFAMDLGYVPKGETISVSIGPAPGSVLAALDFSFNVTEYAPREAPLRAADLSPTLTINVPAPVFSSPGVQNAIQNHANIQAALTQARNHTEGVANANKVAVVKLAANQVYEVTKTGIVLNSSSQQYLFRLDGYERVIIDGQGSTFLIKNAQVGLFLIRQDGTDTTEKIIFQNFKIDFHEDTLPFTQGVIHSVTSLDSNSVKVKFDVDLNQYDTPLDARFTPTSNSGYMYELDENGLATGRMIDGSWSSWVADSTFSSQSIVHEAGDPANRFTHFVTRSPGISALVNDGPGNGWLVRTRHNSNFYLVSVNKVTLDNVVSYASSGTFVAYFQADNVSILNSSLQIKPGSNRYHSSSADALHGRGRQGLWVENSKFEAAGDDLFNAYGLSFVLRSQPNSTTLNLGLFNTSNPTTPSNFDSRSFQVGDQLAFYNPPTGEVLGRRFITAVNAAAQTVTLNAPITGLPLFTGTPPGGGSPETNLMVMNVDLAANYIIRDSEFLNSFRYGMFLKANDVYIMGNTFQGGLEAAIFAVNEPSWPEGFLPERVRIQDNLFEDNARGAMSRYRYYLAKDPGTIVIGTFRNATGGTSGDLYANGRNQQHHFAILDNVFNDWRGMAISVRNARDVLIAGNVFNRSVSDAALRTTLDSTSATPGGGTVSPGPSLFDTSDTSGKYAAIYLHDLSGVVLDDNDFDHRDDIVGNEDDEDFDAIWLEADIAHLLLDDDWLI